MPPATTPINPSQTVERIREIIVGRHLERLEQRVAKLETGCQQPPQNSWVEDRLIASEASIEALQDNLSRFADSTHEATEQRFLKYREETQRLAAQIQQVAAQKSIEAVSPEVNQLEHKIGRWLTGWQTSFYTQLGERDQRLAGQLRNEISSLWENTESQITRLESRVLDRESIEERFRRIAAAARALAECASPSTSPNTTLTAHS
jgi:hypothetical protein